MLAYLLTWDSPALSELVEGRFRDLQVLGEFVYRHDY